ncbi:hypothetical protein KCP76_21095 [Salmonella enterica subsp. enterica serovar Weltevreden]|nr:hypothetical protein KCP76_21095 [Salmonella enterica subsp. enterica serovar Weltevreden]
MVNKLEHAVPMAKSAGGRGVRVLEVTHVRPCAWILFALSLKTCRKRLSAPEPLLNPRKTRLAAEGDGKRARNLRLARD